MTVSTTNVHMKQIKGQGPLKQAMMGNRAIEVQINKVMLYFFAFLASYDGNALNNNIKIVIT